MSSSPADETDRLLHLSLVAVWLFTAIASIVELNGQSRQVLAEAGIASPPWLGHLLIVGYPAFVAMVVVFYLMVNKPQLSF